MGVLSITTAGSTWERSMIVAPKSEEEVLHCHDCPRWYGAEDDELGPCSIKHAREDKKFLTQGYHECDEPEQIRWFESQKRTRKKKVS